MKKYIIPHETYANDSNDQHKTTKVTSYELYSFHWKSHYNETQYNINQGERETWKLFFRKQGDSNQSNNMCMHVCTSLALSFSCGENETKNQLLNKHKFILCVRFFLPIFNYNNFSNRSKRGRTVKKKKMENRFFVFCIHMFNVHLVENE